MKAEDFDRLKQICDENGFEFHVTDRDGEQLSIIVQKKNPWEGVEFVEALKTSIDENVESGKIYKVTSISEDWINISHHFIKGWWSKFFDPSTESAYVEQLKKESFERFGMIDENTVFERSNIYKNMISGSVNSLTGSQRAYGWHYIKEFDELYYCSLLIYQQGKWATKIESFKVTYIDWNYADNGMEVNLTFKIPNWDKAKDKDDIGEYLAEQLTKYLNNEREH